MNVPNQGRFSTVLVNNAFKYKEHQHNMFFPNKTQNIKHT